MSSLTPLAPSRRREVACFLLLAVLALSVVSAASAAETSPATLTVAVANFATSALEPSVGVNAAATLRDALAGNPVLELKSGSRVTDLLGTNSARILTNRPGVAASVSTQVNARVLIFGCVWANPAGERFLQMTAVDCRPRSPRLIAMPPLPWPDDPALQKTRLLSGLQAVLPPVGRVLAIITAGGRTNLQLFPFAGIPLRPSSTYLAYHALAAEDTPGRPDYLPTLWPDGYAGKLLTAAQRLDDAIDSESPDADRVQIGDLVGVALTDEVSFLPSPSHLILSDPPHARVMRGERVLGVTPLLLPVSEASGDLTLTATDMIDQPLQLPGGKALLSSVLLTMTALPPTGTLLVTSDPPGATLVIDGQRAGVTPYTSGELKPGPHRVSASLAGYAPAEQEAQILRGRQVKLNFQFERLMRGVSIASNPQGAAVTWDGQPLGIAPVVIPKTTVGKHTLKLTLADHDDFTREVEVGAGEGLAQFTFDLTHVAGTLVVTTRPAGAQIMVDGQPRGLSPARLEGLWPATYEVSAALPGYRPSKQAATVKAHQVTNVEIELVKQAGQISIKTVPAGALVKLDGKDRGVTPTTLDNVAPGEHVLRLEVANLRAWEGRVTVVDGQTTDIQVGLLPLQLESATPSPGGAPPTTVVAVPAVPVSGGPGINEFEGGDEPAAFPLLALTGGQERSWTIPLLRPGDASERPTDKLEMVFQPHADGALTVVLRTGKALAPQVAVAQSPGTVSATLPDVHLVHNPAGLQINEPTLRSVRLTNTGPGGTLCVDLAVGAGSEVSYSRTSTPRDELAFQISRPRTTNGQKLVALTFDDMPFPDGTSRLLDILREQRVVATFFVIGRKAAEYPALVRRARQDGHSLQNHSYSHPHLPSLSPAEMRSELTRCNETLQRITGEKPTWYRPPGGGVNAELRTVATSVGLRFAGWDVNVHDYNTPSARTIADLVVQNTRAGNIILLHDGVGPTMEALPQIIQRLRAAGLTFVTLDELFGTPR